MIGISRSSNANLATYAGKWIGMDTLETVSTTTTTTGYRTMTADPITPQ